MGQAKPYPVEPRTSLFQRWGAFVVRHPKLLIALVLGATGLLSVGLSWLRLSVREDDLLPQGHSYVQVYNQLNEQFGGGAAVVVGIVPRAGDVFTPDLLAKVARITAAFEAMPELARGAVWSIAAARVKRIALVDGELDVRQLMPEVPADAESLRRLRSETLADPRFVDTLVSKDGGAAAIVADFPTSAQGPELMRKIEAIVAPARDADTEVVVAGGPVIVAALDHAAAQMMILFPLALLVIGLVHYEAFRTRQAMVLPLVTALLSVLCALGFMGWLGLPLDTWSAISPVAILAVAAGHAVQILKRYYEEYAALGDSRAAVISSVTRVGPVMVTAGLIAAAGFASLASFEVTSVRVFGLLMAAGILSALVIEMTFIPAVRALLPAPRQGGLHGAGEQRWLATGLRRLADAVVARPRTVLAVAGGLMLIALPGARRLAVDNSMRELFPASGQIRRDDAVINQRFAGASTLRLLIEGDADGVLQEPEVLRAVADLQRFLGGFPEVGHTLSLVDYLHQMDRVLRVDGGADDALPGSRRLIGQYLLLYAMSGSDDLSAVVDAGYRRGAILAYTRSDETAFAEDLFRRTREFAADRFRGLPVRVGIAGGSLGAQAAVNAVVVRDKIRNLAQVAAMILLLSAIALRSVVGGVFVLVPLGVALAITVGLMGWLGVWLSVSTSAVMAMGVSIGADFAIYLIFRLREELTNGALVDGVRRALVTSGTAIFFVSSAVALGYLVLVCSGFKPWVHLGGLTAVMMAFTSAAAVTVLPALVLVLRPRFIVAAPAAPPAPLVPPAAGGRAFIRRAG
jgi:predicted RND superfamily exporter protein